jgi:hypothetical protein
VGAHRPQERHQDGGQEDEEPPEQQQVHDPGDRAEEQLRLPQHPGDLARGTHGHVARAVRHAAQADEREEVRDPPDEEAGEDREDDQEQDPADEGPGIHG